MYIGKYTPKVYTDKYTENCTPGNVHREMYTEKCTSESVQRRCTPSGVHESVQRASSLLSSALVAGPHNKVYTGSVHWRLAYTGERVQRNIHQRRYNKKRTPERDNVCPPRHPQLSWPCLISKCTPEVYTEGLVVYGTCNVHALWCTGLVVYMPCGVQALWCTGFEALRNCTPEVYTEKCTGKCTLGSVHREVYTEKCAPGSVHHERTPEVYIRVCTSGRVHRTAH
ncbi:hypothetical protein F2Q69_00014479 [Brassica cretica]|uniref:Uncharacterized protein n=1 Tax=Brassica cretica TaxID=69181 RepID=A0A8S9QX83_BRACR|nr:hypothetical protein F2Q69_00014479 [Brassica cretica]